MRPKRPRECPCLTPEMEAFNTAMSSVRVSVACVASVSVQFTSEERGTRVKDSGKNGAKEQGGAGEEGRETLADKPLDFENCPLGLSYMSSHTDILCCHQLSYLTNKMFVLPRNGNEL